MLKKKYIYLIIPLLLLVSFFVVQEIRAGSDDNVYGWAWSDTIGWISFNSTNCDSEAPFGITDNVTYSQCPVGDPISDYGVKIIDISDLTGVLFGYAWSENVGWISFADYNGDGEVDVDDRNISGAPCIRRRCRAAMTSNGLFGWARALSFGGGWDGWIKLDSTSYQVVLDPDSSEFENWAWGDDDRNNDDVIGWVSFNRLNCDTDGDGNSDGVGVCPSGTTVSDYKVKIGFTSDSAPNVGSAEVENEEYCSGSPIGLVSLKWLYQDLEGNNQSEYNLIVANDSSFSDIVVNLTTNQSVSPGSYGTVALSLFPSPTSATNDLNIGYTGSNYYWKVSVKATGNPNWSSEVQGTFFTSPSGPYPNPSFTPNQDPLSLDVTFTNTTTYCSSPSCGYNWSFGDIPPGSSTEPDPTYTYLLEGSYNVTLEAIGIGSCTTNSTIIVGSALELPDWKEIIPF